MHEHSNVHITLVQMPAVNTPQFSWVRSRLPSRPQPVPPIYQPEVAARAIAFAAEHPRRKQYWVGASTVATVVAQRLAPAVLDRYLARTGYSSQQTDKPRRARRTTCGGPWTPRTAATTAHTAPSTRPFGTPRPAAVAVPSRRRRVRRNRHRRRRRDLRLDDAQGIAMTAFRSAPTQPRTDPTVRPRRHVRAIEVVRGAWGLVLMAWPRLVLRRIRVVTDDSRALAVTRTLGARHLVQAALSGIDPSPEVLAAGVWVDRVHAVTALVLATLDGRRSRGAVVDAGVAAVWAVIGRHDLSTGNSPSRDHDRHRDRLATLLLPHLPGGPSLLRAAHAARHRHLA